MLNPEGKFQTNCQGWPLGVFPAFLLISDKLTDGLKIVKSE
jgi:hypothetical protein